MTVNFSGNAICAMAVMFFAAGFPAADELLQRWGVVGLIAARNVIGFSMLFLLMITLERDTNLLALPWLKGFWIGFVGFGLGSMLLLIAQSISNSTTASLAAAAMPITALGLEVLLDKRRLSARFVIAVCLVILGGIIASGVLIEKFSVGFGFATGLLASGFFAWGSRKTVKGLPDQTPLSRTTITSSGMGAFCFFSWIIFTLLGHPTAKMDLPDFNDIGLLIIYSILALSISQTLWIKAVSDIGVGIASFHLNATPFYVMVIIFSLGGVWDWIKAVGVTILILGGILAQLPGNRPAIGTNIKFFFKFCSRFFSAPR